MVDLGRPEESKTLGIRWHPPADTLQYNIKINIRSRRIFKRSILSETAQIFDPLGLLVPAVISAKIVMQELWQLKLEWDEAVPIHMHTQWERYRENLSDLNDFGIPRRVINGDHTDFQLHGFSDASEKAYGACIYVRATNRSGEISVRLLCAKSRVAPLKQRTLPSLELCAAVLLAELFQKVIKSISMPSYFWIDFELVLAYLADEPRRWIAFIGNRVSQIQQLTDVSQWKHVPGSSNPADLVSRGVSPAELIENKLWWTGASWLKLNSNCWPNERQTPSEVPGRRKAAMCHLSVPKWHMIDRFSNLNDLLRETSFCFRFYQTIAGETTKVRNETITTDEMQLALRILVGISQREEFAAELTCLKKGRSLNRKDQLLALNPFIDPEGLLRVGDRLGNSDRSEDQKHPLILAAHHKLIMLIIIAEHEQLLHAGPQSVLANLRLRFWVIRGRNAVKKVIRHYMECTRVKPNSITPQMGHLSANRTKECRPFCNTGVDYAGPIYIKAGTRRSQTKLKGYIALFVCFSTKAIHIELVTDLTTAAFLSALRRFISSRGKVVNLYSDNGTNFIEAARQLQELTQTLQSAELKHALCNEEIKWHFIPPRSPHFGGLWEAGVRSVKSHIKRILGESFLIFEEYYTVLTQIEACLNSRPIMYLSDDPADPLPLTPGHFLIGEALVALPEIDVTRISDNKLIIWDRLQKIKQHFWKRWSVEYLSSLQERTKWRRDSAANLAIDDVVLLKDNQLPLLQWVVGKVSALHPGKDGVARKATITTAKGETTRAITQLCLLPKRNELIKDN